MPSPPQVQQALRQPALNLCTPRQAAGFKMPRTLLVHKKQLVLACLVPPSHAPVKKSGTNAAEINKGKWCVQPGNAAPVLPASLSALGIPRGPSLQTAMPKPWQDTGHVGASPQHNQATGFGQGPPRGLGLALGKHPEAGNTQRGVKQMPALLRRFRVNECTIHSKHMVYPNL